MRPDAGHERAVAAEHRDVDVPHVELRVLDLRIRALAVLAHLLPALGHAAVVVEEIQTRRVPVNRSDFVDVRVTNAVE